MIRSTLCYIEREGHYLMLLRNKKKNDPNSGKWIGVGGKFEEGETPEQCVKREAFEETGIKLTETVFKGVIFFRSDIYEDEEMYLFTAEVPGNIDHSPDCNEGDLKWIRKEDVLSLSLWEGDRCFLKPLLEGKTAINMTLVYEGDKLTEVITE